MGLGIAEDVHLIFTMPLLANVANFRSDPPGVETELSGTRCAQRFKQSFFL
jgi:hypothetical protein